MFAPLLLLLARPSYGTQHVYQWRDAVTNKQLTCQRCPPGTFVLQHCTENNQTWCEHCPDLHYTQYWNYLEKCRYCNVICGEKQVEVQQCNATHNRVCQCQDGYYSEMEFCNRHSKCPPGFGVEKLGTPFENTQCGACPRGFFSSSSSSTEPCQPHQDCEQQGKVVNVEGNRYHDTLCTSCGPMGTDHRIPGDDDCEQAMIDFVAYQNIPIRKLKRLQQILEHTPRMQAEGTRAAMQEKFHALLTRLKDGSPVTKELLRALRTARLYSIEEQARERFLLR
uniref:Uncharacterized protein n=1 Tax=Melopsittacus undulatus TaxID=13146 RepID=A0A8C6IXI2_MELUD